MRSSQMALMIMCSRVSVMSATGISMTTWGVLVRKAFIARNLPSSRYHWRHSAGLWGLQVVRIQELNDVLTFFLRLAWCSFIYTSGTRGAASCRPRHPFGYTSFPSSSVLVDPDLFGYRNSRWQNELSPAAFLIIHFPFVFHRVHRASSSSQAHFSHLLTLIPKKQYEPASSSNTQGGESFAYYNSQKTLTLPKFNSSPLKSYRNPIGKDRLPTTIFFKGELLNFGGVVL